MNLNKIISNDTFIEISLYVYNPFFFFFVCYKCYKCCKYIFQQNYIKSKDQLNHLRLAAIKPDWMTGSLFNNLRKMKEIRALEDIESNNNNKKTAQSWDPGCIHHLSELPNQEGFVYTTAAMMDACKTALKMYSHAFLDDITGFCTKHNGKKWLAHCIYFKNPNSEMAYCGGIIFTLDWTAHVAQKHFAYWWMMFNDYKKDAVPIITWHTDWYVGYWKIIHEIINGMTVAESQIWAWHHVFGKVYTGKIPRNPLDVCNVHAIKGISRRFSNKKVTKKFCIDHWNILRMESNIKLYVKFLSLFKAILECDWIDITSFNVQLLTFEQLVGSEKFDEKNLDERQNSPLRRVIVFEGSDIVNDQCCFNAIIINEILNPAINDPPIQIYPQFSGPDPIHPGISMRYYKAKALLKLSWTSKEYKVATNPTNPNQIKILFEVKGKPTWKYMWNIWLKWIGNYSIMIHKDLKQWDNNQLAESGNRDFKVK